MPTIYMIGHSILQAAEFVGLLEKHEIEVVVDVRSSPYSGRNPQYNREVLSKTLRQRRIQYRHAPELGGRAPLSPEQVQSASIRQHAMSAGRVAFMCSEGDYRDCHRHYQLAPLARNLGLTILQIMRDGSLEEDFEVCASGYRPNAKKAAKSQEKVPFTPSLFD